MEREDYGQAKINTRTLESWRDKGLTLVSLSVVHYGSEPNARIMSPDLPYSPWAAASRIHDAGLSVRINCTMLKGGVQDEGDVAAMIGACRDSKIEQLTLRDVACPRYSDDETSKWTREHMLKDPTGTEMATRFLESQFATPLLNLPHGATVYDCQGQNVCLNNCITDTTNPEEIRQLIFFPSGRLRFSWNYQGAVVL